jgi:hypothetical protein
MRVQTVYVLEEWLKNRKSWHTPFRRAYSKSQSKKARSEPIRPWRPKPPAPWDKLIQ